MPAKSEGARAAAKEARAKHTRAARRYKPSKAQRRKYEKTYAANNPDMVWLKNRRRHYRRTYGIELEQAIALLERQGNACAICRCPLDAFSHNTHVDHCHDTKRVRGILCRTCNMQVGWYEKWPNFHQHAASYLERANVV